MIASRRHLILAASAMSAAALLIALGFEFLGGYKPCPLCLQQRIPYYAGLPVLAGVLMHSRWGTGSSSRPLLALVALGFALGAATAIYQSGAEWRLWPGPSGCSAVSGIASMTADELIARLAATRVVSCTEPAWRFLGLSFAGWNAFVSGAVSALLAWAAVGKDRAETATGT